MVALLEDLQPQHQKSRQSQARQHPPWHRRGTGVPLPQREENLKRRRETAKQRKTAPGHLVLKPWRFLIIIIMNIVMVIITVSISITRARPDEKELRVPKPKP